MKFFYYAVDAECGGSCITCNINGEGFCDTCLEGFYLSNDKTCAGESTFTIDLIFLSLSFVQITHLMIYGSLWKTKLMVILWNKTEINCELRFIKVVVSFNLLKSKETMSFV